MNKKKRNIIIGIIIGVIGLIILFILFSSGSSKNNGYTAKKGDILKVREKTVKFDLKITSSLDKYTSESESVTGDYVRVGLHIDNKYDDELLLKVSSLYLLDENKSIIAKNEPFIGIDDNIISKGIPAKSSVDGYAYFTTDLNNEKIPLDQSVLTKTKFLQVSVLSDVSMNNSMVSASKEDYYIELK